MVLFKGARNKLEKTKIELRAKVKEQFKEGQYKKMEWRPNGLDVKTVLQKIGSM